MTPAITVVLALSGLAECVGRPSYDGDTRRLSCAGEDVSIRLRDVDTPEVRPCAPAELADQRASCARCPAEALAGALVRDLLDQITVGAPMTFTPRGHPSYGRPVGDVTLDGEDLATMLLNAGWALPWPHDDAGRAMAPRPDWCGEDGR